jgi:hypothetical protein
MKAIQLPEAFKNSGKRVHIASDIKTAVITPLDVEGQLFDIPESKVLC